MTQAPTEQIPAEHLLAAHTQREVELAQQAFDLGQQLTDSRARVSALTALVEELKAQISASAENQTADIETDLAVRVERGDLEA